jgi:hypothetical protein
VQLTKEKTSGEERLDPVCQSNPNDGADFEVTAKMNTQEPRNCLDAERKTSIESNAPGSSAPQGTGLCKLTPSGSFHVPRSVNGTKLAPLERSKSFSGKSNRMRSKLPGCGSELVQLTKEKAAGKEQLDHVCRRNDKVETPTPNKEKLIKVVSFKESGNRTEILDVNHHEDVISKWYSARDLQMLLNYDVMINKRKVGMSGSRHIGKNNSRFCVRGLEKALVDEKLETKNKIYVKIMLNAQAKLKLAIVDGSEDAKAASQAEAMRLFSREQTKGDRQTAYRMGLQDASYVTSMKEEQ